MEAEGGKGTDVSEKGNTNGGFWKEFVTCGASGRRWVLSVLATSIQGFLPFRKSETFSCCSLDVLL